MGEKRGTYPEEFRRQMVELVRAGRTPQELSREFEPSAQAIRNWVRQEERDVGRRHDGLTSQEREELRRLRRENRRLKLEREILFKSSGLVRSGDRNDPRQVFGFVRANQAGYPVSTLCRVLEVSASGYYAWEKRGPSARALSDAALLAKIREIHSRSRETYGTPRIHAELEAEGIRVSRKRVGRLMREAGLKGAHRRRAPRTTIRNPEARPAPDLVQREFRAEGPNRLWVADITYVPTWEGFLYLAVVLDAFSRRVVGWSMACHLRTVLVLDALDMALLRRRPFEVIHHSDQGSQYTSYAFGKRCDEAGVRPSMGSVGDCYDNAMCESFFATLECELIDRRTFRTRAEARMAIFEFIEGWYNPSRRHSGLGYCSPLEYERRHQDVA
ncbi:MAG: IS3 family transposase [bacterium]